MPRTRTREDGTRWDCSCPMCQTALASAEDENLCELEVWVEKRGGFERFRTYKICTWSGGLGPKERTGDLTFVFQNNTPPSLTT